MVGFRKQFQISWIAFGLGLLISGLGQGCSKFNFGSSSDSQAQSGSGNGGTYDGKLVFLHLESQFTCENKIAPKSILYRDEQNKWYITINTPQKCASTSLAPINDVSYIDGSFSLIYQGATYGSDPNTPDTSRGLPNYPIQYQVSSSADPNLGDTTPGDDKCENSLGQCSLRAAFDELNSKITRPGIILIEPGTYKISQELITKVNNATLILGLNSSTTIIDGQGVTNILRTSVQTFAPNAPPFVGSVIIDGLTFINGKTSSTWTAAAITDYSTLTVRNSVFKNNESGANGTIRAASGHYRAGLRVESSQFEQNLSSGIEIGGLAGATVIQSSFINNQGSAGFHSTSHAVSNISIKQSLFSGNNVGVLINECRGSCLIENSTLTGNALSGFDLIANTNNSAAVQIKNSTVYNNGAGDASGANVRFSADSIAVNTALNISNSIVASGGSSRPNCSSSTTGTNNTYIVNSVSDDTTCNANGLGNLIVADPLLSTLTNNGGPTLSLLPLTGSPAIDGGDNLTCSAEDQRGISRPIDKLGTGAKCDIGAIEVQ